MNTREKIAQVVEDCDAQFTGDDTRDTLVIALSRVVASARCPGCGDRGDAEHISACAQFQRDESYAAGWRDGARHLVEAVKVQLGRRGSVDLDALAEVVELAGRWEGGRWVP